MEKIAILLPTRNRPQTLRRFWDSIVETSDDLSLVSLYLYIDDDDILTPPEVEEMKQNFDNIFSFQEPRILMSEMPNFLFSKSTEDIIFLAGDDLIMKTKGWDTLVREKFDTIDDKVGLLYGGDGGEAQRMHLSDPTSFATHPIVHRKWGEILGYINPPYFSCDYADTWANDLADAIERKYKLPFFHEHMHFTMGKAPFDSTYKEGRERFNKDNMPSVYSKLKPLLKSDIEKLRKYVSNFNNEK